MSTTPNVISAPSGPPLSNYEQIHQLTSEPEPSQAGNEAPVESAQEAQTESEPQSQPEVSEPGEQAEVLAEAPAAEAETTEEANPYEQTEDEADFKPQTLQEILRTPDGKKMYANHKALREITKAIGHAPTVEQATQYYGAFREVTVLNEYMSSGDPQRAADAIAHLFNPQLRGDGVKVVASQFAPTLAKANPEAYEAAAQPFLNNYSNELWNRFETETIPEVKETLYQAAQRLHKDLTGKYREMKSGSPQPAQQVQNDPFAERLAQLDARETALRQSEQQRQVAEQRQLDGAINSKIAESLYAELDKALAPVKAAHAKTPRVYNVLRKEFHDEVKAGAMQNKAAWDIFQVNFARAKRSGSPEAFDAVAKEYIRLATPAIMANRKKFIEEAGVSAVQASERQHAELRSIDSHKAPSNGGSPAQPSAGQSIERQSGESQSAFNLRQLRALSPNRQ